MSLGHILMVISSVSMVVKNVECQDQRPMYKYRFQTEDVMQTAATSVPVRGYHTVEGGYYPYPRPYDGRRTSFGLTRFDRGGYEPAPFAYNYNYRPSHYGYGNLNPSPYFSEPYHGLTDSTTYRGGKKNVVDENFEKSHGRSGEEVSKDEGGFERGQAAVKNSKGEAGYYSEEEAGKNQFEDGKRYHGSRSFAQQANNGGEKKVNKGHKKGHSIKGFKTSHHKDESGKTEEYYDEANDEGNDASYDGQRGAFGASSAASFKGGHADGKFNAGESKKEGHYDNERVIDNANADEASYGAKKYASNAEVRGLNNGIDQQSLLDHQESEKFYRHYPHHAPIHSVF